MTKNLLVGDDVSYERKIREIIVASRVERLLTKDEILELYLNTIYLGRSSWGVEMAARSYFGKSVQDLSLAQGAMLAGLAKGPNAYDPEKHPQRANERLTYVINRMQENGAINAERMNAALANPLPRSPTISRGAIPAIILLTTSRARRERLPASKTSRRHPMPSIRPSALTCSGQPKQPCRMAWRGMSRAWDAPHSSVPR